MAQWINACNHEDLSSDLHDSHKRWSLYITLVLGGGDKRGPRSSLAASLAEIVSLIFLNKTKTSNMKSLLE